ncbi:hypothetical protein TMEN_5119 [Trichophyton mentagrophytes]|nr:hypothetical protein TMEN_5119 [Trichophyton mentagrophytes]
MGGCFTAVAPPLAAPGAITINNGDFDTGSIRRTELPHFKF